MVELMKKYLVYLILTLLAGIALYPAVASARIGVGVAAGKITVDERLKPGTIYNLPSLSILNTGDETSDYEAAVTYHEKQAELAPPASWFEFQPKRFTLKPGDAQKVDVRLNIPVKVEPGDYFAYLEGHPVARVGSGSTSIGVAAATKLYFTIAPANVLAGLYYKALSYWNLYLPWSSRAAMAVAAVMLLVFFKKTFNIQIQRKPSRREPSVQSQVNVHE